MRRGIVAPKDGAKLNHNLTRRDFVLRTGAGVATWATASELFPASVARAATAPPTTVMVNEFFLRQKYPNDIAALLDSVKRFAERQNGDVLYTGRNLNPSSIKAQLQRHPRRPNRLVIFGDDDAIPRFKLNWRSDKVYFFKGGQYLRYDIPDDRVGPPKPIAGNWGLPKSWLSGVNAALSWSNHIVYFFKGDQYLGYDMVRDSANNPKPIADNWRGFPREFSSGIDSAINLGNGKAYFFKGGQYIRYDIAADRIDAGFPKPIAGQWPGFPESWHSGVNAAVSWNKGKAYFFKGREYIRYDIAADRVDDRYPRPIAGNWKDFPAAWSSGIDFALRAPGQDLSVDYFYGDLDGDGLAEVATSRILGSPQAMMRQLDTPPAGAQPHALFLNGEPRESHLWGQVTSIIGHRGCTLAAQDWADSKTLAEADVVFFGGHGNSQGWYGTFAGAYVTVGTMPDLPRQPVIFAGACSTATPGSPILREFMNKGCRAYLGAASDSYGMTAGYLGNELFLHLYDALRENPDLSLAEMVGEARTRFVRVNQLASTLLQLEKGEYPRVDDALVNTALQFQVFGDITASLPKSQPRPIISIHPLVPRVRTLRTGDTIPIKYEVGPADGLTNIFLRADWDRDVSAGLRIEVWQNGELLHKLDWREQRDYWAYADFSVGGYWEGQRYHALAFVPLVRRTGRNEVTVRLVSASKSIQVQAESELQIWAKRKFERAILRQLSRKKGINVLWLCYDQDLGPMRRALASIEGAQFDHHSMFGEMIAPYEFPDESGYLLDLEQYDLILVDYIWNGYRQFPRGMGARVREFVRKGGGLIMAGGPTSFSGKQSYAGLGGQGGYGGSPVEEALPVRMVGEGDMIVGRTSVGEIDSRHPIAAGLDWSSFPPIFGYNRVVAKPGAAVLARTDARDPFLAVWQYGKGNAAALATSSARDWGAEFKKWPHYNLFWANLIRWVSPSQASAN